MDEVGILRGAGFTVRHSRAVGDNVGFGRRGALAAWGANYAGLSAPGLLVALYVAVVAWNWRQARRR